MTRETKAGLVVSCSFLCLVGIVLYSKLNEKESNGTDNQADGQLAKMMAEPQPIPTKNGELPAGGAAGTLAGNTGVVPAGYRPVDEHADPKINPDPPGFLSGQPHAPQGNSPIPEPAPPQEPATKERMTPHFPVGKADKDSPVSPFLAKQASEEPAKEEKTLLGKAPPSSVAPQPAWPPEAGATSPIAAEGKTATPPAPMPDPAKFTALAGSGVVPGTADTPESAGGGAKPASSVPPGPGPSLGANEKAGATKPVASSAPNPTTIPLPGFNNLDVPKGGDPVPAPHPAGKDLTLPEKTSKTEVPAFAASGPDHSKTPIQFPDVPSSASTGSPVPKGPLPGLPSGTPEAGRAEPSFPRDPHAPSGSEHGIVSSGADAKSAGTVNGLLATGQAATPATPPANPFTFGSSDTASRITPVPSPRPSSGVGGAPADSTLPHGSTGGFSAIGSSAADRSQAFPSDSTPARPITAQPAMESTMNRSIDNGFRAGAPLPASQPAPAPAPTIPAFASGGNFAPQPSLPVTAPVAPALAPPTRGPSGSTPPPAGGIVQVEAYDESVYKCKPNDTFRTISQELYGTDQYEQALLLFNRNHPLAADALRQGSSALQGGQAIYIPPKRILVTYYGAPPSNDSTPAGPLPTPGQMPIRMDGAGSSPPPLPPVAPANISVKPLPPPGSVPQYRVRDGGEMFREIARNTLGDADRWTEIYRLNPRFDPKDPVPGGSELRLPRDATVDPRDKP